MPKRMRERERPDPSYSPRTGLRGCQCLWWISFGQHTAESCQLSLGCVYLCARKWERGKKKKKKKLVRSKSPILVTNNTHTHKKETNEGTRRKKTQQQQQRDVEQNEWIAREGGGEGMVCLSGHDRKISKLSSHKMKWQKSSLRPLVIETLNMPLEHGRTFSSKFSEQRKKETLKNGPSAFLFFSFSSVNWGVNHVSSDIVGRDWHPQARKRYTQYTKENEAAGKLLSDGFHVGQWRV